MTNEQERERVAEILAKQECGEQLTEKEWTILAYSPYGSGGGCASRAPRVERPPPVKVVWQNMFDFGKDLELTAAMFIATRQSEHPNLEAALSAQPEEVRRLEEIGRESKAEKLQGKLERLREIATKGG